MWSLYTKETKETKDFVMCPQNRVAALSLTAWENLHTMPARDLNKTNSPRLRDPLHGRLEGLALKLQIQPGFALQRRLEGSLRQGGPGNYERQSC